MKRTDLIALAERMKMMARAIQETADSEPEARFGLDLQDSAELIEQIAQAQPVAARYDWRPAGRRYIDSGSGSGWLTRHNDAEPLYTLPLED